MPSNRNYVSPENWVLAGINRANLNASINFWISTCRSLHYKPGRDLFPSFNKEGYPCISLFSSLEI